MNAKLFIKTKTKYINLRRNQIGALNPIDGTLFTNNRDRKWRMSVLGVFYYFSNIHLNCEKMVPNVFDGEQDDQSVCRLMNCERRLICDIQENRNVRLS